MATSKPHSRLRSERHFTFMWGKRANIPQVGLTVAGLVELAVLPVVLAGLAAMLLAAGVPVTFDKVAQQHQIELW